MTHEYVEIPEEDVVDQIDQDVQTPEPSPTEAAARAAGWRPKEEFSGDEHVWVDAGEFLRRGELFTKISAQARELKELRAATQELVAHNARIREQAFKQAEQALREQRAEAIETGDKAAYLEAEAQEAALRETWKEEQAKAKTEKAAPGSDIFQSFVALNPWYVEDAAKRTYADQVGSDYAAKHGISIQHATPEEQIKILQHVTKRVNDEYGKPATPSKVEASNSTATTTKVSATAKIEATLSENDRRAMNRYIKLGVMTKEEYLKDYAASGR